MGGSRGKNNEFSCGREKSKVADHLEVNKI
jgi:hypothetical protein